MRSTFFARTAIRSLAALLLLAAVASADTIIPTDVDNTRGESIWINEDGNDVSAYFAGVILIAVTSDGHTYNRDTVCVDLFTNITIGTNYNTFLRRPDDFPGKHLTRASWLVDNALLPAQNPAAPSELASADWVTTAAQGAGLQLAIWDIVHDNGDGFAAGRVRSAAATDVTALGWANDYLQWSEGKQSDLAFVYDNFSISNPPVPAQMLIGPMFADGPAPPVPEPATFGLVLGAVLIGVCKLARSRSRR